MNVSLDNSHRYTRVQTTSSSNFSAPLTLPVIPCGQTVVQDEEQRASSERSPRGRYSCNICGQDYAQPQGLTRHQWEKHKARLCMYCREFTWGRPYLFRRHLVKRHPDIDPNAAMDEVTRIRRSTTIRIYLPRQRDPIPTAEHGSWGRSESQARPSQLTSSPSTVSPSTEERPRPATNLDMSTRTVQNWLVP